MLRSLCQECPFFYTWKILIHSIWPISHKLPPLSSLSWSFSERIIGTSSFIAVHICCIFHKLKVRGPICKEIMTCCIVGPAVLWWSGTKPTISLRYVYSCLLLLPLYIVHTNIAILTRGYYNFVCLIHFSQRQKLNHMHICIYWDLELYLTYNEHTICPNIF